MRLQHAHLASTYALTADDGTVVIAFATTLDGVLREAAG